MFTDKMYELLKDLCGTSSTTNFIMLNLNFDNDVTKWNIDDKLWAIRAFVYDLRFRFEDHYDEN